MNDTARDLQQPDPAAIDGLDDLFVEGVTSSETGPSPSHDEVPGPSPLLSARQAAKILGISKRSVLRLIQEQKLEAIKENGKYLIELEAVKVRKQSLADSGPSYDEGPPKPVSVDIEVSPSSPLESGPSYDEGLPETISFDVEDSTNSLDAYKLLKELEAATYRVGYLEAQLEAERNQVKLLTDQLHKPNWWSRFTDWFLGR